MRKMLHTEVLSARKLWRAELKGSAKPKLRHRYSTARKQKDVTPGEKSSVSKWLLVEAVKERKLPALNQGQV